MWFGGGRVPGGYLTRSPTIAPSEPVRGLQHSPEALIDEPDSEAAEALLRSDPSLLTARHTIVEVRRNLARLLDETDAAAAR